MPQVKQIAEQLIYPFEFAARLGAETLAGIVSATVTPRGRVVQVAALAIGAQAFGGTQVRLSLNGGTDGEIYSVRVVASDTAGQQHEIEGEIIVADLAWTVPDVTTAYATVFDFVDRFGYDEAVRLTDEFGTRRIDKARIAAALTDAQSLADGYLAAQLVVPVTVNWPLLKMSVLDLARLRLYPSEPPSGVKDAGAQALATFKAIAAGTIKAPTAVVPDVAPVDANP
ncbi:MAG TPA: DUF1320 domain-containing protein, partial [Polymorphobacter sp.]|nr:DUF1320 domain-containing protein [Polymorphobacter sp.]